MTGRVSPFGAISLIGPCLPGYPVDGGIARRWDAIFPVLSHPELPPINDAAGRSPRHGVILRKLGLGIRTVAGSRVVALLANAIDTCCRRGHSPWRYFELRPPTVVPANPRPLPRWGRERLRLKILG